MTPVLARDASGQDPRSLLRRGTHAYDFADYGAAKGFLAAGLDPAAGPHDSVWVASLHRLVDILIRDGQDSVAAVWLRWALRIQPGLVVDTLNFPPPVQDGFARAREFVVTTASGDTLTETTWEWAQAPGHSTLGRLRIERPGVPLSGVVEGVGPLAPGDAAPLASGSYTIVAAAPDYGFRARVTREVLPGITTVVRFRIRGETSQARGFLYVASTPWGAVYLDDERVGYTPVAALPAAVGPHRLRIKRAGYVPFDTVVTVGADQRLRHGTMPLRAEGTQ